MTTTGDSAPLFAAYYRRFATEKKQQDLFCVTPTWASTRSHRGIEHSEEGDQNFIWSLRMSPRHAVQSLHGPSLPGLSVHAVSPGQHISVFRRYLRRFFSTPFLGELHGQMWNGGMKGSTTTIQSFQKISRLLREKTDDF